MVTVGTLTYSTKIDTTGFKKGVDDIERKTQSGGTSVKNIIAGLGITKLISTAFATINENLDAAISRFDIMNNFPKVMSNLGIGAEESSKAINKLSDGLQGIPTTLDEGALAVQRFTSKNGDVEKSVDLFLAVNDAILAGGANTQLQSSALEQLSQAYAKGRMDMMEWRTIQMAMPAQLKQIATAMGLTTEELGEMLRTGDNAEEVMEQFIGTIMEMDTKGVAGFKSLKEQARNATDGIQTSITNMKTAITRGITNLLNEFDKVLKKKGLGGISTIITEIGKKAEGLFKEITKILPKIVDLIINLFNILNKLKPVILAVVAAFVTYKATLLAIQAINIAKGIVESVTAFISLAKEVKNANEMMQLLNITMNANPVGIITAAVAAIAALSIAFINAKSDSDELTKSIENNSKALDDYQKEMDDLKSQREEALSVSNAEFGYYESLYEELQTIVDENGKIKDGYEERAKVITTILSDALGIEIEIVDGQIKQYADLKDSIYDVIKAKEAEAYISAHKAEYDKAIEKENELYKSLKTAIKDQEDAQTKYNEKLKEASKELGVTEEHLQAYVDKGHQVQGMYNDLDTAIYDNNSLLNTYRDILLDCNDELDKANGVLDKANDKYAKNQTVIKENRDAIEAFAAENYEAVKKIYDDTVTFNSKSLESDKETIDKKIKQNNTAYEKSKETYKNYLDYLEQNQDKYNADFIESERKRVDDKLKILEDEKNDANASLEKQYEEANQKVLAGINKELETIKGKKYEFKDAGDGNVQLYVDGIKTGAPIAYETASKLAEGTVQKIKDKKMDAEDAGKYLVDGVSLGIKNKQGTLFNNMFTLGQNLLSTFKSSLKENSPSKATKQFGEWLIEGFNVGVEEEENDVLKNIEDFGDDVLNKMQNAVNIQTGKMSFSGTTGSVNQILTATGTTTVVNENKLLLDGDVVYENQKKVVARKNLQTQFGGAYNVSN